MRCEFRGNVIICRSGSRRVRPCSACKCSLKAWKLCDFPMGGGKTCDAVLCASCATHQDPDTDLCPTHARLLTPEGRLRL